MLVPFLPYVLVSLLQLVALAVGAATLAAASKWLLMPALGLALVVAARGRRARRVIGPAAAGILFSWLGDVLLGTPGGLGFLLGLGAFLLAHVSYLVLFVRGLRTRRVPVWAVLLVPWWVALLVVLGPHLGALFVHPLLELFVFRAGAPGQGHRGQAQASGGAGKAHHFFAPFCAVARFWAACSSGSR